MTSQQKQLDFLQILARPVMYNYVLLNKPNYTGRPYCDRCNKNLTESCSKIFINKKLLKNMSEFFAGDDDAAFFSQRNQAVWLYESTPGNWTSVSSSEIEQRFQQWNREHIEHAYTYHCFGDGQSTFVRFGSMQTACGSAHRCQRENCNVFNLQRVLPPLESVHESDGEIEPMS